MCQVFASQPQRGERPRDRADPNGGRNEPCVHGSGYGDVAMYVDDCKTEHARFECEGSTRTPSRGTTAPRRSGRGSSSAGVPTVTGSKCSKGMGATGSGAT